MSPEHANLFNPPYVRIIAPVDSGWGAGKVSMAAIFALEILRRLSPGARLSAILPDVLRSGTLYGRWRQQAEQMAAIDEVQAVGQFDAATDVDVFFLRATGGEANVSVEWWPQVVSAAEQTISDHFSISVGAVVPHRHPESGPDRAYVHARLLPRGGMYRAGEVRRRFTGNTVTPPFVAVRRTCRPAKHGPRILTTIVLGDEPVAVENHLIVLKPPNGDLDDCHSVVTTLTSPATSRWLDERIRCRHLTVDALGQLPWPQTPS